MTLKTISAPSVDNEIAALNEQLEADALQREERNKRRRRRARARRIIEDICGCFSD